MRSKPKVVIRPLWPTELPQCAELGEAYCREMDVPGGFVPAFFIQTWQNLFSAGSARVFGAWDEDRRLVGVFLGLVVPDPHNGETVGHQVNWFVLPEFRGIGLDLMMRWLDELQDEGVHRFVVGAFRGPHEKALDRLYRRIGLEKLETHYVGYLP
ncbi:MAG: GNAT family N-acetyltransferase [candidate division NC10 bacterium]|nr:GNAT family N-acetyltransferase [candidate division NC10 bacterium]